MDSISNILNKFNPLEDKYISREYQSYGIYLAEELNDWKHKALYIKLAKQIPRAILEKAFSFAKDSTAKRKGAYFMWKLKEMGIFNKLKMSRRAGSRSAGKKRLHVFISGRVQGVFFRAFIKEKADELGVVGWVKNLSDGRVEAVFEGEKMAIDEMVKWCYKGNPGSIVKYVDLKEEKVTGLSMFEIK